MKYFLASAKSLNDDLLIVKKCNQTSLLLPLAATKKIGLTRYDILKKAKLKDSGVFNKALKELEQCGFIRKYTCIGNKVKDSVYQLIDNFTLFYFQFMMKNNNGDKHFWTTMYNSPLHNTWAGLAFERVCLQHIEQIKKALGFSAVISTAHAWPRKEAQIDLLIDRNDDTINICEMKYSKSLYHLTEEETLKMQQRLDLFREESGTTKSIQQTLITSYGVTSNSNTNQIQSMLTMDDLFQK